MLRAILRVLLALAFAFAGYAHITGPETFLSITPGWVPFAEEVIFWTGIAELLGAVGLLIPKTRHAAGWALAAYTVCVYPANINHALIDLGSGTGLPLAYHLPRLLFQPVIVWWCLYASEVINWPIRQRGQPRRQE